VRAVHKSLLDAVLQIRPAPSSLLDIGCGDGSFTRALCHCLPNTSITGLDLSLPRYLTGATGICFVEGSVERLPFPSASFDLVTASLSMHHWNDKEMGIGEIARVLKAGGHLVIGDPLLQGWLGNPLLGRLAQSIDRGCFASLPELETYLQSSGFASFAVALVPNTFRSTFLVTAQKAWSVGVLPQ